jgi:hypothetical protein
MLWNSRGRYSKIEKKIEKERIIDDSESIFNQLNYNNLHGSPPPNFGQEPKEEEKGKQIALKKDS